MMLTAGIEADDGKSYLGRPPAGLGPAGCAGVITPELSVGSFVAGTAPAPIVTAAAGGWFKANGGC